MKEAAEMVLAMVGCVMILIGMSLALEVCVRRDPEKTRKRRCEHD